MKITVIIEYFLLFLIVWMIAYSLECYWPIIIDIHEKVGYLYDLNQ